MCAKSPTSERWRQIIIGVAAGVADKYTNLPSTKTEDLIREAKVCNDAIDASGLGKTKGVVSLRQYFDTKVTSIISYNSQIKTMAAKLGNEGSIAF
jgi:transcriptional regulator of NAD metabolism